MQAFLFIGEFAGRLSRMAANKCIERTGDLPRLSGHPELTSQECNYAESRPEKPLQVH